MKIKNIYKELFKEENYKIAYEQIKSKPGNMTKGINSETLDKFSNHWIKKTIMEMKDNSFKFKPSRRVFIPKANGIMRPLGIPSPRDKLIQKVILNTLENKFEKIFLESSHGFRPNRSCHTALMGIKTWRRNTWIIEGNIKGYFDNINHHKLCDILCKYTEDSNFINLYWKLVKAGYIEYNTNINKQEIIIGEKGVPLGGVLSPILSNIYLHELDLYIEKLKIEYEKEIKTFKNRNYLDVEQELKRIRYKYNSNKSPLNLKKIRELKKKLFKLEPTKIEGIKINYIRYADDFLVGIIGSKILAEEIRMKIKEFLEKELLIELNLEKTKITNINKKLIVFLGYFIGSSNSKLFTALRVNMADTRTGVEFKKRAPYGGINLYVPVERVLERLISKEFAKRVGKSIRGIYYGPWINLDTEEIVIRYKSIQRGIWNYYLLAKNSNILKTINYILIYSCAHTLAAKFKTSLREIFKKYGKFMTIKSGKKTINLNYNITNLPKKYIPEDPFAVTNYLARTKYLVDEPCRTCGSETDVEIHHIRHLKNLNPNLSTVHEIMVKMKRKQIPLCKNCHNIVHNGKY